MGVGHATVYSTHWQGHKLAPISAPANVRSEQPEELLRLIIEAVLRLKLMLNKVRGLVSKKALRLLLGVTSFLT